MSGLDQDDLNEAVERLARRMVVARLGLAQGGPTVLLSALIAPVADAIVTLQIMIEQGAPPSYDAVDQPIGPATTDVLADMVSRCCPSAPHPWTQACDVGDTDAQ